jgi:hypothetical protein
MSKTESTLQAKKVQVETEIAIATAKEKGLELDQEVVAGLISRSVKFDRKFLTFLQQYAKASDVNEFLQKMLAKKGELAPEDEEAVTKINSAIKRSIKAFEDFQKKPELYEHVNGAMLKNLLDKGTTLQAAISVQEK